MSTDNGVVVRPLRWDGTTPHPDDLAAVQHLYRVFETSLLGAVDSGDAGLARFLSMSTIDHDATVLVMDGDAPVGVVTVMVDRTTQDVYADYAIDLAAGDVRPLCLDHAASAAQRIAAAEPEPGWTLRITTWEQDAASTPLLAQHGLLPVRRFYRMRIDLDSAEIPESAPVLPDGVELVVGDDDEARRVIWSVDNETFLDHWNFAPMTYEEWTEHFPRDGKHDPQGWWLLRVDGEPAGFAILDETQAAANCGYVSVLGVRRPYRGRGLATLLLQRAFVRYRDLGRVAVELGVDAESLTGAVDLYERVGMRPVRVMQGWARELT